MTQVPEIKECDLLIVGSGAAALSCALTAQASGLSVIIAEKEEYFGGTSAYSGGWLWIPESRHAQAVGIRDRKDQALDYLTHETKGKLDFKRAEAYLRVAPKMIDFVEENSPVRFALLADMPDYHPGSPGASDGGRVLYAKAWNASASWHGISQLRKPLKSMTAFGIQIGTEDLASFTSSGRKLSSLFYVGRRLLASAVDQLRYGQAMRLTSGRALVGGLAVAAMDRGADLWLGSSVHTLINEGGRIVGAYTRRRGKDVMIRARGGVVLATGGFPGDAALRHEVMAGVMTDADRNTVAWGLMAKGNTGDGIRLARAVGARFDSDMIDPIGYVPLTESVREEGERAVFPVLILRAVPGQICVTEAGLRFASEGASYHDWGAALVRATKRAGETTAWFVCDSRSLRRYGLGEVRPWPSRFGRHLRSGYLKMGKTLDDLGAATGIDRANLCETVDRFNSDVRAGSDRDFHRGENAYDRVNGDPDHEPNPCLGELKHPPFFAVKATAGCGSTNAGLATNANAQVVDCDEMAIPGLYAVGNDAASFTGGTIVAGGITLGPAMTFGYIAAIHAATQIHTDTSHADAGRSSKFNGR